MAVRYGVVLTRQAHRDLARVGSPDRGRLCMKVFSAAAREPPTGLMAIRSWRYLAACEVSAQSRRVLVYAVRSRKELGDELAGRR